MRHHVTTAAIGFLAAAILVPFASTEAAAADPTGIWRKADQGERPGKMEVFRCGSGKRYLCVKIVWLQDPLDSRGKPLHDIRNENPSLRGRPILGLPIVNGMTPVSATQWKGNIYNPEDGNTYSATLTLVSRDQIKLKGCKAWLLCGERTWLRTSLPKPEPEPQIEASAEPDAAVEAASAAAAEAKEPENALSEADILTPAAEHGTRPGYRFLNASTKHEPDAGLSGENVPSMFVMTAPIADDAAKADDAAAANAPANVAAAPPTPKPAPTSVAQPKPQTMQAAASSPRAVPSASAPRAAPLPADDAQAGDIAADETETAETAELDEPMTRRQRRMLRRQQKQAPGMLPWLR